MRSILTFFLLCSTVYAQSADELRGYVTKLTETPRVSSSRECTLAATWLKNELESAGYSVEFQPFRVNSGESSNLLTFKEAPLKTVIVVGAHYDSVPMSPGADDNASGTAAVLGLAKRFSNISTRHRLAFQLYAGEEQALVGSTYYVNNPKWPIKDHIFMVNFDMIGTLKTNTTTSPLNVDSLLKPLYDKYPFAKAITRRNTPGSDHMSFKRKDIPTVFLHTGLHIHYHRRTDTAEKLNYQGMEAICNYAYDLLTAIDSYDVLNYDFLDQIPVVRIPR